MCVQSSFCHQFWINTGRSKFEQETDSILSACYLMVKSHKDPDEIDLNVPRRSQCLHEAWKRHQDAVYWVDINRDIEKGLPFYQTRSNAIILHETLPACCIPKVVRLKTGDQELNPWGTTIEEPLHMSTAEKSERPEQDQYLRCQSGPSA